MSDSVKTTKTMSVDEVCQRLKKDGLDTWQAEIKEHNIDITTLQSLRMDYLKEMGIVNDEDHLQIQNTVKTILEMKKPYKLFNDPVHGHIELHPLLVKIIDTPQFQRLRNIKQLGGACFVFPGASHSRFEHSIGVGYLAGELAKVLKKRLSDDEKDLITDKDILCVEIAGLCHDLGHGPFSHLFDNMFLKAISSKKQHEDISEEMFDHMVEENGLKDLTTDYGLEKDDLTFIKKMINPKNKELNLPEGRTKGKSFLFEIVSNEVNDIDVDKFDYFARDCHYLGIQNNFDHRRFLMLAKLCEVDGEKHICIRDKEEHNVYNMFYTRYYLHRSVYQHRVNKSIELMIRDAFVKAKDMKVEGSDKMLKDVTKDMTAYTKLTDRVFEQILNSSLEETGIKDARDILKRIISRDLYQCLGETLPVTSTEINEDDLKSEWAEAFHQGGTSLRPEDFEIMVIKYGKKYDADKKMYFYKKNGAALNGKPLSDFVAEKSLETFIRVYCKKTDKNSLAAAKKHFMKWCESKNFQLPEDEEEKEKAMWLKQINSKWERFCLKLKEEANTYLTKK